MKLLLTKNIKTSLFRIFPFSIFIILATIRLLPIEFKVPTLIKINVIYSIVILSGVLAGIVFKQFNSDWFFIWIGFLLFYSADYLLSLFGSKFDFEFLTFNYNTDLFFGSWNIRIGFYSDWHLKLTLFIVALFIISIFLGKKEKFVLIIFPYLYYYFFLYLKYFNYNPPVYLLAILFLHFICTVLVIKTIHKKNNTFELYKYMFFYGIFQLILVYISKFVMVRIVYNESFDSWHFMNTIKEFVQICLIYSGVAYLIVLSIVLTVYRFLTKRIRQD